MKCNSISGPQLQLSDMDRIFTFTGSPKNDNSNQHRALRGKNESKISRREMYLEFF